ncbi:hypothetical protein HDU91_007190 [Kappamyces sp. JEL0680]|nr:hypothetical protein HDU91_007190 [Kappamyces sp. JEL0680]
MPPLRETSEHTLAVVTPAPAASNRVSSRVLLASAYPAAGIAYFMATPSLWFLVLSHLFIAVLLVIVAIVALFVAGLPLQGMLLSKVMPAGWAWFLTVFITVVESAIATLLVGLIYLQQIAMDRIFDSVLRRRGHGKVIDNNPKTAFGRSLYRTLHPICYMLTTLVAIPINLIPIVGQIFFFILCKYFTAWGCHLHYFDLKGMTWSEAKAYIRLHWTAYFLFGTSAGALEAIPVLGLFFMCTNMIGAALFAADLEDSGLAPVVVSGSGVV